MSLPAARPDTVMGRALASRVLPHLTPPSVPGSDLIDLTLAAPIKTPDRVRAAAKAALDEGENPLHCRFRPAAAA